MCLPVKPSSFFTLIVISLLLSACHSGEMLNPVVSKTISDPIQTQWLGFGYNQDPLDRNKEGHDVGRWDKGRWELTKERINYIRPSLVRINLYRHWTTLIIGYLSIDYQMVKFQLRTKLRTK